nr:MAG TPA_asm: hypothetical protein [Caudoviricetes sp.]
MLTPYKNPESLIIPSYITLLYIGVNMSTLYIRVV